MSDGWKKSDVVILVVISGLYAYSLFRHDAIYQDRYRSREDCVKDWSDDARDCRDGGGGSSGGRWLGPKYEEGARPRTRDPMLRAGRTKVMRGGFGMTGARFMRGGG